MKTRFAIFGLSVVSSCTLFILSCEEPRSQRQPIIGGTEVELEGQRNLGLVTVAATAGNCSGVLLDERWVLTAGHCFAQGRVQAATATLGGITLPTDMVYVFGGESATDGTSTSRGYDLALMHLVASLTGGPFRQKDIWSENVQNRSVSFYGQGLSTYYQPGPPPVLSSSGTWRQANLTIEEQKHNANPAWWDTLVAPSNYAGQVCAPGDSGGPVFLVRSPEVFLLAIQVNGSWTCADNRSVKQCKSTITNISVCRANMIPVRAVEQIIATSWNTAAATYVFDASNEISPHLFNEWVHDMNVNGWPITARAANEMCFNRGFVGGHMTGHQLPGKYGVACAGPGAVWHDANTAELVASGWSFADVETVHWAQARRAANDICVKKGFVGGHFNGHQRLGGGGIFGTLPVNLGLVCYGAPAVFYDATPEEINATQWPVGNLDTVGWAQAARAASNFCAGKGFAAGFMTGHQVPGKYGVVCQRR